MEDPSYVGKVEAGPEGVGGDDGPPFRGPVSYKSRLGCKATNLAVVYRAAEGGSDLLGVGDPLAIDDGFCTRLSVRVGLCARGCLGHDGIHLGLGRRDFEDRVRDICTMGTLAVEASPVARDVESREELGLVARGQRSGEEDKLYAGGVEEGSELAQLGPEFVRAIEDGMAFVHHDAVELLPGQEALNERLERHGARRFWRGEHQRSESGFAFCPDCTGDLEGAAVVLDVVLEGDEGDDDDGGALERAEGREEEGDALAPAGAADLYDRRSPLYDGLQHVFLLAREPGFGPRQHLPQLALEVGLGEPCKAVGPYDLSLLYEEGRRFFGQPGPIGFAKAEEPVPGGARLAELFLQPGQSYPSLVGFAAVHSPPDVRSVAGLEIPCIVDQPAFVFAVGVVVRRRIVGCQAPKDASAIPTGDRNRHMPPCRHGDPCSEVPCTGQLHLPPHLLGRPEEERMGFGGGLRLYRVEDRPAPEKGTRLQAGAEKSFDLLAEGKDKP